jgi:hypothetical protein
MLDFMRLIFASGKAQGCRFSELKQRLATQPGVKSKQ